MATKAYTETVKKWASTAGGTAAGGAIVFLILSYLAAQGAIQVTGFSGDTICAGTTADPCYAYINITALEDVYVYPISYDPYGRQSPMDFDPGVKDWQLQRSWGNGWRTYDLNRTCTGTWCGGTGDTGKYSLAWRKGQTYQLRIIAYKNDPSDDVKWGGFNGQVDPVWIGTGMDKFNQSECKEKSAGTECVSKDAYQLTPADKPPVTCDVSKWGKCSTDGKYIYCDSNYDGNGDGKCQSGESCTMIHLNSQVVSINTFEGNKAKMVECQ